MSNIYKPTWLYIKQHNQTGLKYFGKTVQKDPYRYKGSGKKWIAHLNKHGNDVATTWCQLFTSEEEVREFALNFSTTNNIVESKEWANLKPEDGLWGGSAKGQNAGKVRSAETRSKIAQKALGRKHSDATKKLMSEQRTGKKHSEEWKRNIGKGNKNKRTGRKLSEETKLKMSRTRTGKKHSPETIEKLRISALNRKTSQKTLIST